jgi:tyrosyl-tRNA synthetase
MGQVAPEEQLRILKSGVVDLHVETELLALLRKGKPLCIKAGFDPTRPDLHLGHTVLMNKMRQFQDARARTSMFVVGDFTAQIGDPTGRSATRKVPTREEIVEGARHVRGAGVQASSTVRSTRASSTTATWLGEAGLRRRGSARRSSYTLARMMERDDFKKRWSEHHQHLAARAACIPLAQAHDSVELVADVELGGTDQLFNLMVGARDHARVRAAAAGRDDDADPRGALGALSRTESFVGEKMSKSLDNYVGVAEAPGDMQFGKLMSISDALMWRYYELLSTVDPADVKSLKASCDSGATNPKAAKSALAKEIVARYHDAAAADSAFEAWEKQFSRREVPDDMPEVHVAAEGDSIWLPKAMTAANLATGTSDARRKIEAGAVDVDGERVSDVKAVLKKGAQYVVKAGKRAWAKISVT